MTFFNFTAFRRTRLAFKFKKSNKILLSIVKSKTQHYVCNRESHTTPQSGLLDVLFFGTDEFSVESLKVLYNKYESKVLRRLEVVTVNKGKENVVMSYAKKNKIIVNNWPPKLNASEFHIGIVVSFGHMIPSSIINSFPLGMLNVHASLLPRWRGAAPIVYSIMNGEVQTGITIMKIMPKKFDVGEIVLQEKINIGEHETLPELYARLAKLGATLLVNVLENLPQILQSARPQDEENVTYAPKITSKIAVIKWNEMSARNIYDLHRALLGVYPITATFQNAKIKLHDVKEIKESIPSTLEGEMPGVVIYDKKSDALIIKCKGGNCISVKKVVMKGRSPMSARDFYNGFMASRNKRKEFFV
ncbi:methionyl-tRNA formyltransferase, mitochondrial isoform X1 [Hylaeus anthracinus]|uniref:methionyl-tRNA formyltransferase, mitochondrial isoform X1 n=1 Tax=Hylaeus anthracinus TaxID=313031 RepID=UPI0023B8C41A|nr:methionyl-tRNA formyltransferase, mitochondrial isoform X1 [Hylaeus anthracinus]XP_053997289.1 methionyl-tRNA formyltransferase, mitochondrial isoform X1 [Hylaeus anthracinus]